MQFSMYACYMYIYICVCVCLCIYIYIHCIYRHTPITAVGTSYVLNLRKDPVDGIVSHRHREV